MEDVKKVLAVLAKEKPLVGVELSRIVKATKLSQAEVVAALNEAYRHDLCTKCPENLRVQVDDDRVKGKALNKADLKKARRFATLDPTIVIHPAGRDWLDAHK